MSPTDRNGWIDLLRALGAMAVALFHFNSVPLTLPPGAQAWHTVWLHGHWGVGVFFALSGYCLYPGWKRAPGSGGFLLRRARRILPSYWCSLVLVAGLVVAVRLFTGVNDVAPVPAGPGAWLATLLLATDPVTAVPAVNWVYWTLSCILGFYLLTGLLLLARPAHRLGLLVALHALLCLADAAGNPAPRGPLFLVSYWPVFGSGLALAVLQAERRAGLFMLLVSALHAGWASVRGTDPAAYVVAGILTAAVLALLPRRPLPDWLRPLARIGEYSYSLYLIHVPVGIYLLMRFLPDHFTGTPAYIATQLLQLTACVAFARLFYLLAERPFLPPAPLAASARLHPA
jgi:peptidoglycan/LPS O-acetylase OafA/YrhL